MALQMLCVMVSFNLGAACIGADGGNVEEGFVSLFNGRDLTGWHLEGKPADTFTAEGGELRSNPSGYWPTWLRSDKSYENFVLRFDYKIPYYCESGLVIHAPLHGRIAEVGIKIVITEDTARGAKTQHTGTILGVAREKMMVAEKHSTWYPMEVSMDYPMLRVTLNGKVVQEIDCAANEKLRYRLRQGYLGFTAMGAPCSFRNIRIKELPSKETWLSLLDTIPGINTKGKRVPLLQGKNYGGWNVVGRATWEAGDGEVSATGDGYLITDKEWQNLEIFTYIRATPHANGGIFFRWKGLGMTDRAYEIQIYNNPQGDNPTGSIYSYVRNPNLNTPDNEWIPMQIFVRGKTVFTRVNGEDGAFSDNLTEFVRPGRISLQMHTSGCRVEWKELRIKSLDAPGAPASERPGEPQSK